MTVATGSEPEVTWKSLPAPAPSPACTLQTLGIGDSGEQFRQKRENGGDLSHLQPTEATVAVPEPVASGT